MSWGNGQQNGQRQRKIPEMGKGRLRKQQKKNPQSPDFGGLVNIPPNQHSTLYNAAIWYSPPKQMPDGTMLPEIFEMRVTPCDAAGNFLQQPQGQQQMPQAQGWAPQPQGAPVYAQPAPGPQYAPGPQPPQHGGYAPAPGYTPPQPQPAPQPQQRPTWGGQPAQGQAGPPSGAGGAPQTAQGGYRPNDVPF